MPFAIAAIAGLVGFVTIDRPVPTDRVNSFARRHGLRLTSVSAPHVVRYLAVTRRWRTAGLCAAIALYLVWDLQHQRLSLNVAYALLGWFAGAVLAELRVVAPMTRRRVASLDRRTVGRYVPTHLLGALAVATGTTLTVAGMTRTWPALGLALGLPLLTLGALRVLVNRPQATDDEDVRAADEAIRRNSAHGLCAAATTLLLYASAGPLVAAVAPNSLGLALALSVAGLVGIPLLGWRLGPAA